MQKPLCPKNTQNVTLQAHLKSIGLSYCSYGMLRDEMQFPNGECFIAGDLSQLGVVLQLRVGIHLESISQ